MDNGVSVSNQADHIPCLTEKMECGVTSIHNEFILEQKIMYDEQVRIDVHHPLFLLCVCGIDFSKLKKITLVINGIKFHNTSDNELKYTLFEKGVVIIMSDTLCDDIHDNKAINLNRKDTIDLKIETTDIDEYTIQTYGINYNVAFFKSSGSFGGLGCTYYSRMNLQK